MHWLKQSTAVDVMIGPFLDETDGKTAETGLTISQADVRLSKNGGNMAQKNDASACTHDELGWYKCDLDATDTATLGALTLMVHESGALPVWHEYMVLPANVWDSLFGADKLKVHADEITAGLITASAIANSAITSTKIASAAITNAKLAAGAIGATKVATASWQEAADEIMARNLSIGDAAAFDFRTLYGAISSIVNKRSISGSTLTLYKSNDSDVLTTIAIGTDADQEPINSLDPA